MAGFYGALLLALLPTTSCLLAKWYTPLAPLTWYRQCNRVSGSEEMVLADSQPRRPRSYLARAHAEDLSRSLAQGLVWSSDRVTAEQQELGVRPPIHLLGPPRPPRHRSCEEGYDCLLLRRSYFDSAAQWALHSSAVVVAANGTLAASRATSAEGIGVPDAPPVGALSCIASLRLNRSLVSSAARQHYLQRLKHTRRYVATINPLHTGRRRKTPDPWIHLSMDVYYVSGRFRQIHARASRSGGSVPNSLDHSICVGRCSKCAGR